MNYLLISKKIETNFIEPMKATTDDGRQNSRISSEFYGNY